MTDVSELLFKINTLENEGYEKNYYNFKWYHIKTGKEFENIHKAYEHYVLSSCEEND